MPGIFSDCEFLIIFIFGSTIDFGNGTGKLSTIFRKVKIIRILIEHIFKYQNFISNIIPNLILKRYSIKIFLNMLPNHCHPVLSLSIMVQKLPIYKYKKYFILFSWICPFLLGTILCWNHPELSYPPLLCTYIFFKWDFNFVYILKWSFRDRRYTI